MTKENKAADFLWMNLGVLLLSVGVYFFKIPNGFSPGGVSGIGTILGKITPNVSPSVWIMIINILLLFVGFIVLGKGTGGKTVYCSMMFSLLTVLFERFIPLSHPISNQPFLELCYAMLLSALGSALMFDKGASLRLS